MNTVMITMVKVDQKGSPKSVGWTFLLRNREVTPHSQDG